MLVKIDQNRTPNDINWDSLQVAEFPVIASVGAAQANTTVLARKVLPVACKILLVTVYTAAIADLTGDHSFNVVVGTGAYTQGSVAPTDNSFTGPLPGGVGFPTVFAAAGQAVFGADQALTAGAGVGVAATTLEPALAVPSTGADSVYRFVPTVYDAVYPAGTVLTLRAVTPAATGSITDLLVSMAIVPVSVRTEKYPTSDYLTPGVEF